MTSNRSTNLTRPHTAFARVLSFVLLGLIVYGTTIEAAHKHGGTVTPGNRSTASSVTPSSTDDAVVGGLMGCSDCLICQLHQSFSSALSTSHQISPPPQEGVQFAGIAARFVPSKVNAPRSGRAPPAS